MTPRPSSAIGAVTGADGLIVVTPVFAASYSGGLFKSFFDVIDPDALMAARPVGEEPEDDVTVLERRLADLRFD